MKYRQKLYEISQIRTFQKQKQSSSETQQKLVQKNKFNKTLQEQQNQKNKRKALQQLFSKFKNNQKFENFFNDLFTIKEFKEQWQNKTKNKNRKNVQYYFRENKWYPLLNIFQLFLRIILFWLLSVFRVFDYQQNNWIFAFTLIVQIVDIFIKLFFILLYKIKIKNIQNSEKFDLNIQTILINHLGNFYCIVYSILGISNVINSTQNMFFLILDITILIFIYKQIGQFFKDIKLISLSSQVKSYIKLVSLMIALIMIIHFFAIVMFFASKFTTTFYLQNVQGLQIFSWFQIYIYSLYFAGTTILTVGYGDILPRNIFQIIIVLVMQIFGVVITVYLNGEVGNILFVLRKQKENLYNDLSVLERLKSNFNLTSQTTEKIRDYLINNRRIDEEKSIEQQNNLLNKISSDLREQAKMTNNLSLIKQSLFLTVNLSIKAQLQLSHKLIRWSYSPNQNIYQINGKERFQIIARGQIALYVTKRQNGHDYSKKILKILKKNKNQSSFQNCFGQVSIIMGRQNRISMLSKDFSTCYGIERKDFYELMSCDNEDFQKFHQMKQKFLCMRDPQQYEIQEFNSEKNHYVPKVFETIKVYLKQVHFSKRKMYIRQRTKYGRIYEKKNQNQLEQFSLQSESQSNFDSNYGSGIKFQNQKQNVLTQNERSQKYKSMKDLAFSQAKNLIVQRNYKKRYLNSAYLKRKQEIVNNQNKELEQPFQIMKNYHNYNKNFNPEKVLDHINYYPKVMNMLINFFQSKLQEINLKGSPVRRQRYQRIKTTI